MVAMRTMATSIALAVALAVGCAGATPATALAPGVHVDPGSPAGKEYSFPLGVLRGAATGHSAPPGVAQPRFGAGIGPAGAGSAPGGASRRRGAASSHGSGPRSGAARRGGRRRHGTKGGRGTTGGDVSSQALSGSRSRRAAAQSRELANLIRPRSPAPQVALIAVPVLLVGAALGGVIAAVRRRWAS